LKAQEIRYKALLRRRVALLRNSVEDALHPHLLEYESSRTDALEVRHDNTVSMLVARMLASLATIRGAFDRVFAPKPSAIQPFAEATAENTVRIQDRLARQGGIPTVRVAQTLHLAGLVSAWTEENVALIKTIDGRYFADIERLVIAAVETGQDTPSIARILKERYGVSRARADLIAEDQISKLNGKVTEQRQTELGIEEYKWRDCGDERVRPSHKDLSGKIFTWKKGSPEGHPGQPVRCRCRAEPIIPEHLTV
jgi:SPP1 gp7 family putative phage head morphogenesis protein